MIPGEKIELNNDVLATWAASTDVPEVTVVDAIMSHTAQLKRIADVLEHWARNQHFTY